MKKLTPLLILIFPLLLFAQKDSTKPSFKIAKKKPQSSTQPINKDQFAPIIYSTTFYQGVRSFSDVFRKNDNPSLSIQRIGGLDIYLPTWLPNSIGTYYIKTGFYDNILYGFHYVFSVPMDFGFIIYMKGFNIILEGGQRFFFHCSDPLLSDNILFEWGGGLSKGININKNWRPLQIALNYKRLANEGFVEFTLYKEFGAIF